MLVPSLDPIYVGLSGLAGSGKTTVANLLAPTRGQFYTVTEGVTWRSPPVYSHYILAAPIYEVIGVMRLTEGDDRKSRIKYGLYDILTELLEKQLPFDEAIDFIKDVSTRSVGTENDAKPRTMMQVLGDDCRSINEDCFVNSVIRKAKTDLHILYREIDAAAEENYDEDLHYPEYFSIISDVRYGNEVARLKESSQLVMVRLEVTREEADSRLFERDGVIMTEEQWNHPTEAGFPDDVIDFSVNTNEKSAVEVAQEIKEFLLAQIPNNLMEAVVNG